MREEVRGREESKGEEKRRKMGRGKERRGEKKIDEEDTKVDGDRGKKE